MCSIEDLIVDDGVALQALLLKLKQVQNKNYSYLNFCFWDARTPTVREFVLEENASHVQTENYSSLHCKNKEQQIFYL